MSRPDHADSGSLNGSFRWFVGVLAVVVAAGLGWTWFGGFGSDEIRPSALPIPSSFDPPSSAAPSQLFVAFR